MTNIKSTYFFLTFRVKPYVETMGPQSFLLWTLLRHPTVDVQVESSERRSKCLKKLSTEDIASFEGAADLPSKVKTSKSVSFKDCWARARSVVNAQE